MKYISVRIWSRVSTTRFAVALVRYLMKKGQKVANFDNYGLDNSSFRLDIRYWMPNWKASYLKVIENARPWKEHILLTEVAEWKEPELVKVGHDLATTIALRYRDYRELPSDPITVAYFLAFMLVRCGAKLKFPHWHREYDAKKFEDAYHHIFTDISVPLDFTILDRVMHNFMNNIGLTAYTENMVFGLLGYWFMLTNLENVL